MFDSGTATRTADALERIAPEEHSDLGDIACSLSTKNWVGEGEDCEGTVLDYLSHISTQLERIANVMEQRSKAPVVEAQQ